MVVFVYCAAGGGGMGDWSPVIEFAYDLAKKARLFTLDQVARHPLLASRTQPVKRASEVLRTVADDFEHTPGPFGHPHRYRLTNAAKRRLGVKFRNVPAESQKVGHWLALGDVYTILRLNGGVQAWETEPENSANFDIFLAYGGKAFLLEVQRYPINSRMWAEKWRTRMEYLDSLEKLKTAPWQPMNRIVRPKPVLVNLTNQMDETVGVPHGVLVCKRIEDLPVILRRYIERPGIRPMTSSSCVF